MVMGQPPGAEYKNSVPVTFPVSFPLFLYSTSFRDKCQSHSSGISYQNISHFSVEMHNRIAKKYAKPWATNTRRLILRWFYPADLSALPSHLALLQGHAADNLRHVVVQIRRHRILGEKQVLKAAPAALASSAICVMAVSLPNGSVIVSHLRNPQ
jgi:hypothetical protein